MRKPQRALGSDMEVDGNRTDSLSSRKLVRFAFALVVTCTVIELWWSGRSGWCICGEAVPWVASAWSSHTSQHFIDPYSFTHLLHGFAFCGILAGLFPVLGVQWRLLLSVLLEGGWEMLENSALVIDRYRSVTVSIGYQGDTIANSLGDMLCCAVGFLIARRLGWRRAVAVYVVTEILLLLTIHDNLTLNLLMLVYPIESIKTWQLGTSLPLPR